MERFEEIQGQVKELKDLVGFECNGEDRCSGVRCDLCGNKECEEMIYNIADVSVCEGCYEHFNERWD